MDAYAFATSATPGALDALRDLVDEDELRVMLPLTGDYAAYAAGSDVDVVLEIDGLGGVSIWHADDQEGTTPTWAVVLSLVGFTLLRTAANSAPAVAALATAVSGVVGVAFLDGEPAVLVEVTAGTGAAVTAAFAELAGLSGVVSADTAIGEVSQGRGFQQG